MCHDACVHKCMHLCLRSRACFYVWQHGEVSNTRPYLHAPEQHTAAHTRACVGHPHVSTAHTLQDTQHIHLTIPVCSRASRHVGLATSFVPEIQRNTGTFNAMQHLAAEAEVDQLYLPSRVRACMCKRYSPQDDSMGFRVQAHCIIPSQDHSNDGSFHRRIIP
jgi:hypothetical protein